MRVVGQRVRPRLEVQPVNLLYGDADGSDGGRVSAMVSFVGVLGRILGVRQFGRTGALSGFRVGVYTKEALLSLAVFHY